MAPEYVPLRTLDMDAIADLFNRCFEDYVVPVHVSAEFLTTRFRRDAADLNRSFAMRMADDWIALAIISPRFKAARLAGMGVAKPHRGQGVGRRMVAEFLQRMRAEGFTEAYLEVIEQNPPAVKLYESFGFEVVHHLSGFEREPFENVSDVILTETDPARYVEALVEDEAAEYPWLHSPWSAVTLTMPARCYTVDGAAFAMIVPPGDRAPLFPAGFVVRKGERGKGKGRELFQALQSLAPHAPWSMPPIFSDSLTGFMEALGFSKMKLSQFEMRVQLAGTNGD